MTVRAGDVAATLSAIELGASVAQAGAVLKAASADRDNVYADVRAEEVASLRQLWYRAGIPPVPIRWLLVRDPNGELDPQAFLATDLDARPQDILAWFVRRWQVEVTFDDLSYCTPPYVIEKTGPADLDRPFAELLRDGTLLGTWQHHPSEAPKEHSHRLELPGDVFGGSCAAPSYL